LSAIAADTAKFLAAVEAYAPGQAARFAPALDELIRWSEANGLEYRPPTAAQTLVRYAAGGRVFWSAVARAGDGAKLTCSTTRPSRTRCGTPPGPSWPAWTGRRRRAAGCRRWP
jgi:hypothetical protein